MRTKHPSRKIGGDASRPPSSPSAAGQAPGGPIRSAKSRGRPGTKSTPPWGDQSLEERIPSFLEALYFESAERSTAD